MIDLATRAVQEAYPARPIWHEIVSRLATPHGHAAMVKALMRGAVFKHEATVLVRHGQFVAVLDFEAPIGPERQDGIVVPLGIVPERGP